MGVCNSTAQNTSEGDVPKKERKKRVEKTYTKDSRVEKEKKKKVECEFVQVPDAFKDIFMESEHYIEEYFGKTSWNPKKAEISVNKDRFILVSGDSLTVELYKMIMINFDDEKEGEKYYRNFLFDLARNMGRCDCSKTFEKRKEVNGVKRLAAGPIYFAFTGFARVRLMNGTVPSTKKEEFCLVVEHPFSFEAHSFRKYGFRPQYPICCMGAGYAAGWCGEAFSIKNVVGIELTCVARGDPSCVFVVSHRDYIFKKIENLRSTHFTNEMNSRMYVPDGVPGLVSFRKQQKNKMILPNSLNEDTDSMCSMDEHYDEQNTSRMLSEALEKNKMLEERIKELESMIEKN